MYVLSSSLCSACVNFWVKSAANAVNSWRPSCGVAAADVIESATNVAVRSLEKAGILRDGKNGKGKKKENKMNKGTKEEDNPVKRETLVQTTHK